MTVDEGAYYVCSHGNICNDTRNKIYSPGYRGDKYECCAETFMNNINHAQAAIRCRAWLDALHVYNATNLKIANLKIKLQQLSKEISEYLYTININNDIMNDDNKSIHERYKIISECQDKLFTLQQQEYLYYDELNDIEYIDYPCLTDYLEKRIK